MDARYVTLEAFTAFIIEDKCGGCRTCEGLCPYGAIEMVDDEGRLVAHINQVICKGCGVCAAACPAGAAVQHGFRKEQIMAEIIGVLAPNLKSEILDEKLQEEALA
ncbi:MAG: 4Fe-4S binding protein [Anaerolineales bacterium]|nr:4Fe-4S binding protein [Anaerolineales bacterium]